MNEWLFGAGGLIIPYIIKGICYYYKKCKEKKSKKTGKWETIIYDDNDEVVKKDIIDLKHNVKTDEFKGTIKREYPYDLNHRNWECKGIFVRDAMLLFFWSKEEIPSCGVEYLVLADDYTYRGYYLKQEKNRDATHKGDITRVKITNKKK